MKLIYSYSVGLFNVPKNRLLETIQNKIEHLYSAQ